MPSLNGLGAILANTGGRDGMIIRILALILFIIFGVTFIVTEDVFAGIWMLLAYNVASRPTEGVSK